MKWITITWAGPSKSGKTSIYIVRTTDGHVVLGEVRWFGRWRKYAFYPDPNTVYEQDCLRDIATFCEDITRQHRQGIIQVAQ
jgi:hypothetical protein